MVAFLVFKANQKGFGGPVIYIYIVFQGGLLFGLLAFVGLCGFLVLGQGTAKQCIDWGGHRRALCLRARDAPTHA